MSDKKKRWTIYNQLVLGASIFDIFSSFALALGALPVPKEQGVYGAQGNDHTCRLQGFMFQVSLFLPVTDPESYIVTSNSVICVNERINLRLSPNLRPLSQLGLTR